MERILEKLVRTLKEIEKDLSGIKSELVQIRKHENIAEKKGGGNNGNEAE